MKNVMLLVTANNQLMVNPKDGKMPSVLLSAMHLMMDIALITGCVRVRSIGSIVGSGAAGKILIGICIIVQPLMMTNSLLAVDAIT